MISKKVIIKNKLGLHLRAVSQIVSLAHKYNSDIFVLKDNNKANGKSILGILTLEAGCGSEIEIQTQGPDAKELINAIVQLINEKFGEKE